MSRHNSASGCGLPRRPLIFGKDDCQEGAEITFPPLLCNLLKFSCRIPCLASYTNRTPHLRPPSPPPPHWMGESTLSCPTPPLRSSGGAGAAKVQVVPSDRDPRLRERCLDDDDGPSPLWRNPSTTRRDRVMQGRGGVLK
ncbi:hypothetical protein CSHISOI_08935 [Colletotrichum shisoi]|uniref:Uncharacterized protein n=1 Tax=Colletotrichum shisoi TaxID=2078593 RepID=A0A5Q4BI84_9PEZI|nr:hypothetical protein CSHISOI_08935 [Colletotrichum shisoi]